MQSWVGIRSSSHEIAMYVAFTGGQSPVSSDHANALSWIMILIRRKWATSGLPKQLTSVHKAGQLLGQPFSGDVKPAFDRSEGDGQFLTHFAEGFALDVEGVQGFAVHGP